MEQKIKLVERVLLAIAKIIEKFKCVFISNCCTKCVDVHTETHEQNNTETHEEKNTDIQVETNA